MIHDADILAAAAALIAITGLAARIAGLAAVRRFLTAPRHVPTDRPAVSVLKPLCGDEPLLEAALTSCFDQAYPRYQLVFGVADPADPALAVVRRVAARFPQRDITIVADPRQHGINRKVSNLINMLPAAKHEVLVLSDSDAHTARDYLDRLVAALAAAGTGLVTTVSLGLPYRRTWAARLAATQITHGFLPGALLARALGRQDCLGGTMALTRKTLARIGGFETLVHHLADDNVLGQRVRGLGLSVALAATVPSCTVSESNFAALWEHELRWARTIRALAPAAFAASIVQYPLFWAAVTIAASRGSVRWIGFSLAVWIARAAIARGLDRSYRRAELGGTSLPAPFLLLPLRDILSVVELVASFLGDRVVWRGHVLVADDGRGDPASAATLPESFMPSEGTVPS